MKLNQDKIQRMINGQGSVAGGGGSSFDPSVLFGLATEQWTEENYVSKTFFNELFVIHKLTTTVVYDENDQEISRTTSKLGSFLPNELPSETETVDEETGYKTVVTIAVDNIEAKKGVWTNFFMSALGLNDAGGGGGVGDVTWDALEDDTDYRQIALSHLTTALTNYATQTWVQTQGYVTQSAIADMATKTWVGQQGFLTSSAISDMATKTWVGQQGYLTSSAISDMATKTWVGQQGFITSVTGTFWGRTFTNGGTVTGTLESVQHIQMTGHLYLHYNGAGIYLNSDGTGIDWHDANNDYVSSLLAFTSGQVQFNQDAYIPAARILRIGDAVFEWDSTNNAVKVRKATGANDAVNFYATGGVSALGYGASGGGGTGDVTWDALEDDTDYRQIAISHITTALSGYATQNWVQGAYLPLTGGTLTGGLTIEKDTTIYHTEGLLIKNEAYAYTGALWQSIKVLAPSIPDNGGGVMGILFGKAQSTNNGAWFGYVHNSSNSTLNRLTIGFINNDNLVNILASGNVGIGTTSPSYKLHVVGNIYASGDETISGNLTVDGQSKFKCGYFYNTNPSMGALDQGTFVINASQEQGARMWYGLYIWVDYYSGIAKLQSGYENGDTTALDLVLQPLGGNVGIGTSSPSYKLHVNGTFYANGNSSISGTLSASSFIKNGGTSSQFLKADGSVDSNSYATASSVTTLQGYFTNGSANTAIKLQTARLIWGQSFDGSADIGAYNVPTMQFVYFINYNNTNAAGYVGRGYGNKNTVLLCAYSGNDVSIGANNRHDDLYINTDGNIGIGTTSPSYKLSVNGDVSATNFRGTLIGNASSATKLETARTIWGQSFDGSANVDEMIRVLIATSSVGENIVAKFLQYTGNPLGLIVSTRGSDGALLLQAQRESNNNETFNMALNANGGNVGIGTSSPSYKLHVVGNIYASGDETISGNLTVDGQSKFKCGYFYNTNPSMGALDQGTFVINASRERGARMWYGLYIWVDYYSGIAKLQSGYENGNTAALNLVLQPLGGNVGIGTSSPSYKLHIVGTTYVSNDFISDGNVTTTSIELNGRGTLSNYGGFIDFHYNGSTYDYTTRIIENEENILSIMGKSNTSGNAVRAGLKVGDGYNASYVQIGNIRLVYNDSTNSIRVVRYDGTAANLYATGGISALGISGSADGTVSASLIPSTTGTYELGSSSYGWEKIYLSNNSSNTYTGTIYIDGDGINLSSTTGGYFYGNIFKVAGKMVVDPSEDFQYTSYNFSVEGNSYFTGSISASNVINRSDMRLKDVLDDLKLDLQTIANAPLFKFTFRKGERRVMVGTSAQYWQVLLPEAVFADADGMLGLDYGVTALASAISLAREVSEHDRRIAALEAENMVLRAEIKNLKAA